MKKTWIAIVAVLLSFQCQATGNHLNNKSKNERKTVELTKKSIEKQKKPPKKVPKPDSPNIPAESNASPLDRVIASADHPDLVLFP